MGRKTASAAYNVAISDYPERLAVNEKQITSVLFFSAEAIVSGASSGLGERDPEPKSSDRNESTELRPEPQEEDRCPYFRLLARRLMRASQSLGVMFAKLEAANVGSSAPDAGRGVFDMIQRSSASERARR